MVFDGRYKLIENKNAPLVLYDLQKNPSENNNIAEQNQRIVKSLKKLLPPWFEIKIKENMN